jgi:hypothetical protein
MMTHTKGPWEAEEVDISKNMVIGISSTTKKTDCHIAVCFATNQDFNNPEIIDNARLIAAAPDLLEACKVALENNEDRITANLLRAAIAKAEGETT